jgi:hypothetical protein
MNARNIGLVSAANFRVAAHLPHESAALRDKPGFWANDLARLQG